MVFAFAMGKRPDSQHMPYRKPHIFCYEKLLHAKYHLKAAEDKARCSLCGEPLFDVFTVEKECHLSDVCVNISCESRRHKTLFFKQKDAEETGVLTYLPDQNDRSKPT